MMEYRMTNGKTIIIETARTASAAAEAGAARLGCDVSEIRILDEKKRKTTEREKRQQSYWEKYADFLLRVQRQKKSAPQAATKRDTKQNISM